MAASASMKSLRIKTGSCKRILKELNCYEKEVECESAKASRMKDVAADAHDLKQQENVVCESKMMIPNCKKRLESALGDLRTILEEVQSESCEGSEEIEDAKKVIADIGAKFELCQ